MKNLNIQTEKKKMTKGKTKLLKHITEIPPSFLPPNVQQLPRFLLGKISFTHLKMKRKKMDTIAHSPPKIHSPNNLLQEQLAISNPTKSKRNLAPYAYDKGNPPHPSSS